MIRRSIHFNAPSPVKFQLYVSHVRSILEYCSPLWSPTNVKDILLLERVHRHATKYILNNYSDMSYAERCMKMSMLPFYFHLIDLVVVYKYLNNYVDCDFSSYFELVGSSHSSRSSNTGTLLKLPRVKKRLPFPILVALCVCGILCLGISVRQAVYFLSKNMLMTSIF